MTLTKELYNQNYSRLFSIGYKMCKNTAVVQDAIHDTFIGYYHLEDIHTASPSTVLVTILRNVLVSYWRRSRLDDTKALQYLYQEDFEKDLDYNIKMVLVAQAIATLPDGRRSVIKLHLMGMSYAEIARILQNKVHNVRVACRVALLHVKEHVIRQEVYQELGIRYRVKEEIATLGKRRGVVVYDRQTGKSIKNIQAAADLVGMNVDTLRKRLTRGTHDRFKLA